MDIAIALSLGSVLGVLLVVYLLARVLSRLSLILTAINSGLLDRQQAIEREQRSAELIDRLTERVTSIANPSPRRIVSDAERKAYELFSAAQQEGARNRVRTARRPTAPYEGMRAKLTDQPVGTEEVS